MKNELGIVKQKLDGRKIITVKGRKYTWNPVYRDYYEEKIGELLKWKTVMEALEQKRKCLISEGAITDVDINCRNCQYLEKCLNQ